MARHYTGRDGALYVNGVKVGKTTAWTINGSQATLETTTLGDSAATYVNGKLGYTGSCTVIAYETDANVLEGLALLTPVFRTTPNDPEQKVELDLRMENGSQLRRFRVNACITGASSGAAAGGLQQWSINFTVSGLPLTVVL